MADFHEEAIKFGVELNARMEGGPGRPGIPKLVRPPVRFREGTLPVNVSVEKQVDIPGDLASSP